MGTIQWINSLDSFSYCLEMFVAAAIYFACLKKRNGFWLRIAGSAGILFVCSGLVHPFFNDITNWYNSLWFLLVYFIIILLVYLCCDVSFYDAVYAASCGYVTQHFASTLYIILFSKNSAMPSFSGFSYYAIYVVVYVAAYIGLAKRLSDGEAYHASKSNAFTVVVTVLVIALVLSVMVKSTTAEVNATAVVTDNYSRLFIYTQLYALFACFLFFAMQVVYRNELRTARRLDQKENLWKQRQLQYEMSRENIDLINRKCHDLKHQIAALAQEEGMGQKRRDFVKEVQRTIQVYDSEASTGNEALDTILMEKGLYCRLHGIEWTCVADGRLVEFVDVVDLYTMLGNALDNAVESVEKCREETWKTISVRIWKRDYFAVLQVENACDQLPEFRDGLPVTSKPDQDNHGFGVRSIKTIAEKYQGTISVKAEDHCFLLSILIPLPKAAD